ncbi:MAG TPA: trehalose-phosphatase [Ktedonobacterales bacterium]
MSRRPGSAAPWPSPAAEARLRAALAARPVGLFSDVDGTLSPIAPTPEAARLAPGALDALVALQPHLAATGLISGREPRDLIRIAPAPGLLYAGNHGFERATLDTSGALQVVPIPEAEPWRATIHEALAALRAELGQALPGARFEDKGVTASVHVRMAADPATAERIALAAARRVARRTRLRVTRGRMIVELRPPLAMDKGVVIGALITEFGLRGVIYLGDDRTDMDAFQALLRLSGASPGFHSASVAVLHEEAPPGLARAADVTVAGVAGAVALLRWLAGQAAAHDPGRDQESG